MCQAELWHLYTDDKCFWRKTSRTLWWFYSVQVKGEKRVYSICIIIRWGEWKESTLGWPTLWHWNQFHSIWLTNQIKIISCGKSDDISILVLKPSKKRVYHPALQVIRNEGGKNGVVCTAPLFHHASVVHLHSLLHVREPALYKNPKPWLSSWTGITWPLKLLPEKKIQILSFLKLSSKQHFARTIMR